MRNKVSSKGGRPSKPASLKRGHVVTVKLTGDEYTDLCSRAKSAGCRLSEFIRHAAFRLTIVSRLTDEEREIARKIVAMFPDFNQAQTTFNTFKMREATKKLETVVSYLFTLLKKLRLNKIKNYVCENT